MVSTDTETTIAPGDRVRTRRNAEHILPGFDRTEGEVLAVLHLGSPRRPWARIQFDNGRMTTLPHERLERVDGGEA